MENYFFKNLGCILELSDDPKLTATLLSLHWRRSETNKKYNSFIQTKFTLSVYNKKTN
jgi:hypothetical protein